MGRLLLRISVRIHEIRHSGENVVTTPFSQPKITQPNINALRDLNHLCSAATVQLGSSIAEIAVTLLRLRVLRRIHAAPQHNMLHFCYSRSELYLRLLLVIFLNHFYRAKGYSLLLQKIGRAHV
jgi:hypothetical protein